MSWPAFAFAQSTLIKPWDYGEPSLHRMLSYGGAHSHLQAVMSTYDQPCSAIISVFAARMLLEEAARLRWRFSISEHELKVRARQKDDLCRVRSVR